MPTACVERVTRSRTRDSIAGAVGLVVASLLVAGCGATSNEPLGGPSARGRASGVGNDVTGGVDKSIGLVAAALGATAVEEARGVCRPGMVAIEGRYCIDRYEASLVEVMPGGEQRPFSPFSTVAEQHVRAVSEPQVFPQGYISATQAKRACTASGKRLCKVAEWQRACRGPANQRYGYAEERQPGRCNDKGKNPIVKMFGFRYDASTMNHPQLNQLAGTLAKTGEHSGCSNGYGVYDMVGNLHEWVDDPNGTFYGGYYQDVASAGHGNGCSYRTTAHGARYHDYSTGFRCCADLRGADSVETISEPASPVKARPAKAGKSKPPRATPRKGGAKRR